MLKLSKAQQEQARVILDGIFKVKLKKPLTHLAPKKFQGYQKYIIISAVYNVEKYLKAYFNSFIHQRLDFENNILLILVDDGSTDTSASIIKKYQSKYPKNIIYLHKENGGQASARNLGLEYLKEYFKEHLNLETKPNLNLETNENENLKTPANEFLNANLSDFWVNFTDPDDFLDRSCLYEVDKFVKQNQSENLAMIACSLIFYIEKFKIYKDNHSLNFKFKKTQMCLNSNLNDFIQLSFSSVFLPLQSVLEKNIKFDENLKPNFEDAKFVNEYLLENLNAKSAFLKTARYFYRKRADKSSTLDNKKEAELKQVLKLGYLFVLLHAQKKCVKIPAFIQNVVIYDLFWVIKDIINQNKFAFHSKEERAEFFRLFDEIFALIDEELILNFNIAKMHFFYKVGILNCFKKSFAPFLNAFIEEFDDKNEQILISYFTPFEKNTQSVKIDGKELSVKFEKTLKHSFLERTFCYEKRFWINLAKDANRLEIFINGAKSKIYFEEKELENLAQIHKKMQKLKIQRAKNKDLWILADAAFRADDNAEHLYRYIAKNHPKQNIAFILQKSSKDYARLEKEGFKLSDPKSFKFKYLLHKADKIISSHIDKYIFNAFGGETLRTKDFIFLQHGVTKDDLSSWLNKRKIDCFITSTKREFESITKDYNAYKFSTKEMALTGLARHDALLRTNQTHSKQILIMPTWRQYLGAGIRNFRRKRNENFTQSKYYICWKSLLNSEFLKELCQKYKYELVFNPHPHIEIYTENFKLNSFIKFGNEIPLQELFAKSALLITDYSSVAFEMAYLGKAVLYYQFDKEEFFANHLNPGYFSYEKDGFGPVCYTEEALLQALELALKNECEPKEPYKTRLENSFEFKDGKCCERIYEKIKNL